MLRVGVGRARERPAHARSRDPLSFMGPTRGPLRWLSTFESPFCLPLPACTQVSERTGAHVTGVRNVTIWGNHSSTQYPDVNHGTVDGKPIRQVGG